MIKYKKRQPSKGESNQVSTEKTCIFFALNALQICVYKNMKTFRIRLEDFKASTVKEKNYE